MRSLESGHKQARFPRASALNSDILPVRAVDEAVPLDRQQRSPEGQRSDNSRPSRPASLLRLPGKSLSQLDRSSTRLQFGSTRSAIHEGKLFVGQVKRQSSDVVAHRRRRRGVNIAQQNHCGLRIGQIQDERRKSPRPAIHVVSSFAEAFEPALEPLGARLWAGDGTDLTRSCGP